MLDPPHGKATPADPSESSTDRDVKIEQLLLAGLDHYFKAEYDRAIDLWTRVLFLDRSHARARAYIDRARAAAAERLRESEELLHTGTEAFKRGDVGEARALLSSAVARGRDEALPLLDRLDRLDRLDTTPGSLELPAAPPRGGLVSRRALPPRLLAAGQGRRVRVGPLVALFVALGIGAYVVTTWDWIETAIRTGQARPAVAGPSERRGPLPVPSQADVRLERARRLVDQGAPHEAIDVLGAIAPGDPRRIEADQLRAAIQAGLLGLEPPGGAPPESAPPR